MNLFAFKNLAKNLDLKEDTDNYQVNLMESENSEDLVFKISLSQEGTISKSKFNFHLKFTVISFAIFPPLSYSPCKIIFF